MRLCSTILTLYCCYLIGWNWNVPFFLVLIEQGARLCSYASSSLPSIFCEMSLWSLSRKVTFDLYYFRRQITRNIVKVGDTVPINYIKGELDFLASFDSSIFRSFWNVGSSRKLSFLSSLLYFYYMPGVWALSSFPCRIHCVIIGHCVHD